MWPDTKEKGVAAGINEENWPQLVEKFGLPSKAKLKKCMSIDEKPQSHGRLGESFLLSSIKSFVSKVVDKGKKAVVSGLAAQVIKRIPKQFQTLARAVLPYAIKGDFGGAIKSLKGVARQAVMYPIMLHYFRVDPLAWQCIYLQRIRQVVSPEYFTHTEPINFDLTEELKKEEWSEPPKYDRCPGNSLRKGMGPFRVRVNRNRTPEHTKGAKKAVCSFVFVADAHNIAGNLCFGKEQWAWTFPRFTTTHFDPATQDPEEGDSCRLWYMMTVPLVQAIVGVYTSYGQYTHMSTDMKKIQSGAFKAGFCYHYKDLYRAKPETRMHAAVSMSEVVMDSRTEAMMWLRA